MKQPAVLVIDIGTTLVKVGLFDFRCRLIDRISSPHGKRGLGTSFDGDVCWQVVVRCSAQLSARNLSRQVVVVGITGFMHHVVAMDPKGKALTLHAPDSIVRESFKQMLNELGTETIYEITGSRLDPTSVPPNLVALHKHCLNLDSKIATILPIKDFIRYRLTNEIATDEIDACGTMLYALHRRRWDPNLLSYCGLSDENMPPVLHCTTRGGVVTQAAAEALQIPAGIPVSVGGGDDIEILGSGAVGAGEICEHVGSTGSFLLHTQTAAADPKYRLELYPAIDSGRWVLGGSCSNVTRALDWFLMASVYSRGGTVDWNRVQIDLSNALKQIDCDRPLFLPYLYGERVPVWNPDLKAGWQGLHVSHVPADLLLAVIEGVCFSLRAILDVYKDLGIPINLICSSGGLNDLGTTELRASLYGHPVRQVRGTDPTSFAAAAIALATLGELSDPKEAVAWLDLGPSVDPKPEWVATLERGYRLFVEATTEMLTEVIQTESTARPDLTP